jgi:hypothetical protein
MLPDFIRGTECPSKLATKALAAVETVSTASVEWHIWGGLPAVNVSLQFYFAFLQNPQKTGLLKTVIGHLTLPNRPYPPQNRLNSDSIAPPQPILVQDGLVVSQCLRAQA